MEYSYVLIHFDDVMKKAVLEQLNNIPGVTEIEDSKKRGEILVKVQANSEDHVRSIIIWKIQKMACVRKVSILDKNKNFPS